MAENLINLSWVEELYTLSQTAASATVLEDALNSMLRHIASGFEADSGTLALMVPTENVLEIAAGTDLPKEAIGQRVEMGQGVLGRVAQRREPMLINGTLDASNTSRPAGVHARRQPSSAMCWPLLLKGQVIGVFSVNRFESDALFQSGDVQRGSIMANMLALVIENLRMHRDQQLRIAHLSELNARLAQLNGQLSNTQAKVLQNEKMASIGQLAAGVAHEINNPIGFVSSNLSTLSRYVNLLLTKVQATQGGQGFDEELQYVVEDVPELLKETRNGLERVSKIVQDLRDFSRIDAGDEWELADVNAALRNTASIGLIDYQDKLTIDCVLGDLPPVRCLLSRINLVFLNVLVNAAQASLPGGVISIRSRVDGEMVCIDIEDHGCGIPSQHLARIFEPFFTTRPVGHGTGLGLSLAYSIMQLHHGSIDAHSEVGRGTTCHIRVPIRQP
jgi:two-component system NtrC family sensor kinase